MNKIKNYDSAVKVIKEAILKTQYESLKNVNEKQLLLYYAIGKYVSLNTRNGSWGSDAIALISEKLDKEMPCLRGFSERNIKNMRIFYETWFFEGDQEFRHCLNSAVATAEIKLTVNLNYQSIPNFSYENFFSISFTHHMRILQKTETVDERIFYINKCATELLSCRDITRSIERDDYHHQGQMTNNFVQTISNSAAAFKAIDSFKDEYLLDFMNVEELNVRDKQDIDERVLENQIVHNIKNFILTFGKGFAFIRNQYHLDAFGEDQYIDLLFFNRDLNCLVAIELKKGYFKTSYLGQLSGYLSVLDKYEKKEHENPSIGIVLCKNVNKSFVDFVIRDYSKPMGVATYKTSKDMSEEIKKALPSIEELTNLIDKIDEDK